VKLADFFRAYQVTRMETIPRTEQPSRIPAGGTQGLQETAVPHAHKAPDTGSKPAGPAPEEVLAPDWVPEPTTTPDPPDQDLGHHMEPEEEPRH
jgi:hypothetical protein